MRVVAALFGIIMLLPGLCSLGFMGVFLSGFFRGGSGGGVGGLIPLLWLVCFGISFCGILLLRFAFTGARKGGPSGGASGPVGGGASTGAPGS